MTNNSHLSQRGKEIVERLNAEARAKAGALTLDSGLSPDSDWTEQTVCGESASVRMQSGTPPDLRQRADSNSDSKGCSPQSESDDSKLYADVKAILAGELPDRPQPTVLRRKDGRFLFYERQVNLLFGDPESGKTWIALAAAADAINAGRRVLVVDLDHNGCAATVGRLLMLGASRARLIDQDQFRYCEPDDGVDIRTVVADMDTWKPHVAVVDSVGELLPMLGADSNSADDFTRAHTRVLKPLAKSGAAVIAIDHPAKGAESRAKGPGGTAAKRRAIGGASLRVKATRHFTPGQGGVAMMFINKDRHGGLREHCPVGEREPVAGTFHLASDGDLISDPASPWWINTPSVDDRDPDAVNPEDITFIESMNPKPTSAEQVRNALACSKERANRAWAAYKEKHR